MATKSIGYVADLVGEAQVRSVEGVIKVLNIGDRINEGDILTTGLNTQIVLEFYDGQKLQLGENTEILLDESVFASLNAFPDDRVDQLAELQSLIVEGVDLAELEATAAGAAGSSGDALHQASVYSRDGQEGIVETRVTAFGIDSSGAGVQSTLGDDVFPIPDNSTSDNSTTATAAAPAPTIDINTITVDNIINAIEDNSDIAITGTTTGIEDNQTVTLVVNGQSYTGTVIGNSWSVTLPAADAQALTDGSTYAVTANVSDVAGNAATQASSTVLYDISAPTIGINTIAVDNIIDSIEDNSDIAITGTTTGVEDNQTVTVVVNEQSYTNTVIGNS